MWISGSQIIAMNLGNIWYDLTYQSHSWTALSIESIHSGLQAAAREYSIVKWTSERTSTLFFIRTTFIRTILQFWRAISENVDTGMKIVTEKGRGDPKNHFKHIFGGGQGFLLAKTGSKK